MARKRTFRLQLRCDCCHRPYKQLKSWLKHQSRCRVKVCASFLIFIRCGFVPSWIQEAGITGKF